MEWTTRRLAKAFIISPLIVTSIYLCFWTIFQDWNEQWYIESDGSVLQYCQYNAIPLTMSAVIIILTLVWLIRLAIGVRTVPKNFNESFWLGGSIYTVGIVLLFLGPVSLIDSVSYSAKRVMAIISGFILQQSMLAFLFWIKFYLIKYGSDGQDTIGEGVCVSVNS